ncbi:MAG: glycosyltransferase family 2 protein [Nitrospirae bacterium]|nr:glycosyltransferase family 2 protein [Nitrospirota bacterium]
MPKISILIPVYNAEQTIAPLCRSLIALYSAKYDLEIVLVNDGSRDRSDGICRELSATSPETITYLRLSKNFGEHNARMAGLHYATGDYCVMMDDDMQHPPEEVEKLVNEALKGYDAVYSFYPSRKDGFFKKLGSAFNDRVANMVLGKPNDLYLSSFKIINRFLIEEITKYDGPEPYIDGIILQSTDNIGKVAVVHRERSYGESQYTLLKMFSLWGSMVVNFSLLPFRIIGISGFLLIVSGLLYGIYKAYDGLHDNKGLLTNYETLMAVNIVFRGIALLSISLLGEYVGRIYLALNRTPQFVIREVLMVENRNATVQNRNVYRMHNGRQGRS